MATYKNPNKEILEKCQKLFHKEIVEAVSNTDANVDSLRYYIDYDYRYAEYRFAAVWEDKKNKNTYNFQSRVDDSTLRQLDL